MAADDDIIGADDNHSINFQLKVRRVLQNREKIKDGGDWSCFGAVFLEQLEMHGVITLQG